MKNLLTIGIICTFFICDSCCDAFAPPATTNTRYVRRNESSTIQLKSLQMNDLETFGNEFLKDTLFYETSIFNEVKNIFKRQRVVSHRSC